MQLSPRTIEILNNFSKINKSIAVNPGNILATVQPNKTVMAKATVADSFDTAFAIYDLPRFLGTLSLFENPELTFKEKSVVIGNADQRVNYVYADTSTMVLPPSKDINFPDPEVTFDVKKEQLKSLLSAQSVLQLPEIAVVGEDGKISLRAVNSKDPSADEFKLDVGDSNVDFRVIFNPENLKMILDTYTVSITLKGIAKFEASNLVYFVATESKN